MRVGGDKGLLVQKGEVPSKYTIVLSFLWEHYYVSFGFECPIGVEFLPRVVPASYNRNMIPS